MEYTEIPFENYEHKSTLMEAKEIYYDDNG